MAETTQPTSTPRNALVAPRGGAAVAKRESPKTVADILNASEETQKKLAAIATKYLPADRALRIAINAVQRTPLLKQCSPGSFLGALMSATSLGLEPNTLEGLAFLIPYKNSHPRKDANGEIVKDERGKWIWDSTYQCQLQIGYKGFIRLFYRVPIVRQVAIAAIARGDHFDHMQGSRTFLEFKKNLEADGEDIIGSFCHVGLKEGESFTVLRMEDIEKSRAKSQTWASLAASLSNAEAELGKYAEGKAPYGVMKDYQKAKQAFDETPWENWFPGMCAKTAARMHVKAMTLEGDSQDEQARIRMVNNAADLDGMSEANTIDYASLQDPERVREMQQGVIEPDDMNRGEPEDEDGEPARDAKTAQDEPAQERVEIRTEKPAEAKAEDAPKVDAKPAANAPKQDEPKAAPAAKVEPAAGAGPLGPEPPLPGADVVAPAAGKRTRRPIES